MEGYESRRLRESVRAHADMADEERKASLRRVGHLRKELADVNKRWLWQYTLLISAITTSLPDDIALSVLRNAQELQAQEAA